ncbi:MAG: universal stress protein [Chloroflexota bacterium]
MFNHLLVPLDGSALAECVLPHAVALSRALDARVTLLRVCERSGLAGRGNAVAPLAWRVLVTEAGAYLDRVAGQLRQVGLHAETVLLEGQAAETVIEFARGHQVDLIMLSSHGQSGLSGWNISSVVQKIIMRACIPVMIARAYRPVSVELTGLRYSTILVPLDGSQRAECVLPLATALARASEAKVLLAHVACRPDVPRHTPLAPEDLRLTERLVERSRSVATRYFEELRARLPMEVEFHLLTSHSIPIALHDLVERESVDLVVLSAHGSSGGMKWPYGSVAVAFIAYCTSPLLIVQDLSPEELERSWAEMMARETAGH